MSRRARWTYPARHALATLLLLAVIASLGTLLLGWPALLIALLTLNCGAFTLYGIDKRAARHGRRRVPEATLHAVALLGGSAGALLAQRLLRHKTAKRPFQAAFWLICAVQAAALCWFLLARRTLP